MFICEQCGAVSQRGEKSVTVVIERVKHIFPSRADANRFHRAGKIEITPDFGGTGFQIAKEIRVHERCVVDVKITEVK
jgi:hypothetical protein